MVARQIVVLDSAKEEFKEIKKYIKEDFGSSIWSIINSEYKSAFALIKINPEAGSPIDELREVGVANIKYILVRQTRVVYEFNESMVLIHMFVSTKKDFRTHLLKRLFS
jgi:plasmid stabilization system protein ParE